MGGEGVAGWQLLSECRGDGVDVKFLLSEKLFGISEDNSF